MVRSQGLLLAITAFSSWATCVVDDNCSLNGVCIASTCNCDSGWIGPDCGKLDLRPADRWSGYNRTSDNTSSWGGKVVRDIVNASLWHIFVAEFTGECGLDYWAPMSRIVRAESTSGPAGPFVFAAEVAATFATNPTVAYSPADNMYLLYYIGCPFPQPEHCAAPHFSCGTGDALNGESGVSLLTSPDLLTWTSSGMVFNGSIEPNAWDADTSNPSPFVLANGSVILAYRGCPENCQVEDTELISIASASTPAGPFERSAPGEQPIFANPNEDPHVWQDSRGNWHLLMHSLENGGGWGGPKIGRHAFARDVHGPWTFGNTTLAFNTTVQFTDGSVVDYSRRERPQLLWSEDAIPRPIMLTTGVQEKGTPQSYTLCQPIG